MRTTAGRAAVVTAVIFGAAVVGAALGAWLLGVTYLELWASEECRDVLEPGRSPSCAAPAAPWWVLLLGATVGGSAAAALGARLTRRTTG